MKKHRKPTTGTHHSHNKTKFKGDTTFSIHFCVHCSIDIDRNTDPKTFSRWAGWEWGVGLGAGGGGVRGGWGGITLGP